MWPFRKKHRILWTLDYRQVPDGFNPYSLVRRVYRGKEVIQRDEWSFKTEQEAEECIVKFSEYPKILEM
jgi:hypothetical protein